MMAHDLLALSGVAVLAAGFIFRINPLLAVLLAAATAGLTGGLTPLRALTTFGHAFNTSRSVTLVLLVLPVIGLLERHGLQLQARARVARLRGATAGRILLAYMAARQLLAAVGLTALGGPAQMVRPLVAPMAETAAEAQAGQGAREEASRLARAFAASADNIGVFFGEDIFLAFGSVLLIRQVLSGLHIEVAPLRLSLWAIPTALCAFLIHGFRLLRLDRRLRRMRGP